MITDTPHAVPGADDFRALVDNMNARFKALTGPVFETDATDLFDIYLGAVTEPAERQRRNCTCCRRFIARFGALVTVADDGQLVPALWDSGSAPASYRDACAAMERHIRRAALVKPFLSSELVYGKPETNGWRHFALHPERVYRGAGLLTAFQTACARREEFDSVRRALDEYPQAACATALRLLKADTLASAEAALGQAQFLVDLHAARAAPAGARQKDNVVYRMVAAAPPGFCHPRSSMIATLLDDIVAGKTFEEAAASWAAKMHPLKYLRPQAAPSAGAIAAAEAAFDKLGAGTALKRRYATMADIAETVWQAAAAQAVQEGIFASVRAKIARPPAMDMRAPPIVMTLDKFQRTVLPAAEQIAVQAFSSRKPFVALTTAVHADARPILQWDTGQLRNPVAWFVYNGGSLPAEFNLAGSWYDVTAIVQKPHAWAGQAHPQHGDGMILLLKGARDMAQCNGQSALFPSCMKGEFHGFRSTIEAYSQVNALAGFGDDNVAGLLLARGEAYEIVVRVMAAGQYTDYRLDRWD